MYHTHCSRFQCLFSTPDWFTLIRCTASVRSSGVKNEAVVGESGKKNLKKPLLASVYKFAESQSLPEKHGSDQGDATSDDHQPTVRHFKLLVGKNEAVDRHTIAMP